MHQHFAANSFRVGVITRVGVVVIVKARIDIRVSLSIKPSDEHP